MTALIPSSRKSPELLELEDKRRQLEMLEADFANLQLEYSTFAGQIGAFRNRYYLRVGILYARLDTLRAEIREFEARKQPDSEDAQQLANRARQQANETCGEISSAVESDPVDFQPSAELKHIYRLAAKQIHPDRAKDEEDRQLRDRLMAEVNSAYSRGDDQAIVDLLERYRLRLDSVDSDDIGAQLVWAIRSIARTRERIAGLQRALTELESSEWARLKAEVDQGEANGQDPLGKLADALHAEILAEQKRLNTLTDGTDKEEEVQDDPTPPQHDQPAQFSVFRPEGLIHRTERGEKVRSKSEAIIANILNNLGLDYRYEYPIEGNEWPGIRRPDFVLFSKNHKPLLWEHLGMLDDPDYCARWDAKLEWYRANGFTEGINLFVTRDETGGGLDSQLLRKTADHLSTLVTP
jgi:hypothetical protein